MPKLLVVDDEPNLLYSLKKGLQSDTVEVITASTAGEGISLARDARPDAVIMDVRLPDMSGLEAFGQIHQWDSRLPVIVVTAYTTTETAITAMKQGAFDYLVKPVDLHRLRSVVERAFEVRRLSNVPAVFGESLRGDATDGVDHIVGNSPAMQEIYKAIGRVAPLDVPVLIRGESGTGKELVARAVYQHSRRGEGPFLAINCAALPETLLESELFGHERGAFTGADRRRIGKFEQCHRGTLFLDEIGDMAASTQAKVLRLLQDGHFERVGGNETIHSDVRILAATNKDLEAMIDQGRFRLDLLYRLNTFTIHLPPLRDRPDDLAMLVAHFVAFFSRQMNKTVASVSPEAMDILSAHSWPGNVRELQSAIRYAIVQAAGDVLTPECFPQSCRQTGAAPTDSCVPSRMLQQGSLDLVAFVRQLLSEGNGEIYRRVQLEVDRVVLREVLRNVAGNQVQASDLLGISRTTLRVKLGSLSLTPSSGPADEVET